MEQDDLIDLPNGLYRIWWKEGGTSLAAVGVLFSGDRWLAPCNWVNGATTDWSRVARVELLEAAGQALTEGAERGADHQPKPAGSCLGQARRTVACGTCKALKGLGEMFTAGDVPLCIVCFKRSQVPAGGGGGGGGGPVVCLRDEAQARALERRVACAQCGKRPDRLLVDGKGHFFCNQQCQDAFQPIDYKELAQHVNRVARRVLGQAKAEAMPEQGLTSKDFLTVCLGLTERDAGKVLAASAKQASTVPPSGCEPGKDEPADQPKAPTWRDLPPLL